MDTTIQISRELLERLAKMKMYNKESYEEVIWDMIEDRLELSEETKKDIEISREDIKAGRTISLERLKKKLGD
ncbi:hypothetical protein J4229_03430 [Candidatus Pacearchaeota archaeon]|nr:hypothetical protein [Candidatus Pacearchaeota archaeon]